MDIEKYLSITSLNRYIKFVLDKNSHLQSIYLKGEISNFKAHSSGHLYFSLKDENSRIKAIMFKNSALNVKFKPADGMSVLIHGKIGVYEQTGEYQIYVDEMLQDGVGNLYIAFEKLKEKLKNEGLFDEKYKKRIPKMPNKIGIITAPTGAAIKDILTTLKRRYNLAETILFPALVQGDGAKESIVKQIEKANSFDDIDLIILGRGGGSIEDLWPFNEEIVAKAIFNSNIPIISAVGHEVDFTISDFVADLRAPTPTAAAEMSVPNIIDIKNYLLDGNKRLSNVLNTKVRNIKRILNNINSSIILRQPSRIYEQYYQKLDMLMDLSTNRLNVKLEKNKLILKNLMNSYIFKNPQNIYTLKSQYLENLKIHLYKNYDVIYEKKLKQLDFLIDKLEVLNPINAIKRGYAIVKNNNKAISKTKDIKLNDTISIEISDGIVEALIKNIKRNE